MSKDTSTKTKDKASKNTESKTDKSSSSDSGSSDKSGSGATAKGGSSARPISYFSSVATDEYREGWANIFGKPGKVKKGPTTQKAAAEKKILPKSIRLSDEDITEDLQAVLLEALKKRARKNKLGIGRQLNKATLSWSIDCRISE